jgi:hypothetical protein
VELEKSEHQEQDGVLLRFLEKILADHQKNVEQESKDVYSYSLICYKDHLNDIESRDVNALKKKVIEMRKMKDDLIGDLEREFNKERDFVN